MGLCYYMGKTDAFHWHMESNALLGSGKINCFSVGRMVVRTVEELVGCVGKNGFISSDTLNWKKERVLDLLIVVYSCEINNMIS